MYSQDLSNLILALVESSAASNLLMDALQAFLSCGLASRSSSLFFSVDRLCQIPMDTSGAHSFRTMAQSKLWKAYMMNTIRCVRIVQDRELSRVRERTRRKRSENSVGRSLKVSQVSNLSLRLALTRSTISRT